MSFRVVEDEGTATLFLGEKMTLVDAEGLHAALLALLPAGRRVLIDAAQVKSLHSGIVQILLSLWKSTAGSAVVAASPEFAAIFERIGVKAPA
jgi:anti-anti-sigma regulatory factor